MWDVLPATLTACAFLATVLQLAAGALAENAIWMCADYRGSGVEGRKRLTAIQLLCESKAGRTVRPGHQGLPKSELLQAELLAVYVSACQNCHRCFKVQPEIDKLQHTRLHAA